MNPAQEHRYVAITPPVALVNTGSWTCAEIDTLGYDYCTIIVQLGDLDGGPLTVLRVTESHDAGNNHVNMNAATLEHADCVNIDGDASALPVDADDNTFQVFEFDLRHRRRYLQLIATIGANNGYLSALAILTRAKTKPVTMAEHGVDELIRI